MTAQRQRSRQRASAYLYIFKLALLLRQHRSRAAGNKAAAASATWRHQPAWRLASGISGSQRHVGSSRHMVKRIFGRKNRGDAPQARLRQWCCGGM